MTSPVAPYSTRWPGQGRLWLQSPRRHECGRPVVLLADGSRQGYGPYDAEDASLYYCLLDLPRPPNERDFEAAL